MYVKLSAPIRALLRRIWDQIIRLPSCRKGITRLRIAFLISLYGFIHLLFTNIAPWADSVADDLDIEVRHLAKTGAEHKMFARNNEGNPALVMGLYLSNKVVQRKSKGQMKGEDEIWITYSSCWNLK